MFQWYKAMERAIITINEHGTVYIPCGEVWMSEIELTDFFGVIALTICAAIRAVYKRCIERIRSAEVYPVGKWIFCRCV